VILAACLITYNIRLLAYEIQPNPLGQVIPDSLGNCGASTSSGPAPTPCEGTDDLYSVHKSWAYKAEARWVTGLKTIDFSSIVLTNTSGAGLDGITILGAFGSLPASIHIEQCATFDKCTKLWDNTHACCGSNKKFSTWLGLACDAATHELKNMGLKSLTIDTFELQESLGPISLPAADITNPVHDAVYAQLQKYLTSSFIPLNGTDVTLVQYLNAKGAYYISQLC